MGKEFGLWLSQLREKSGFASQRQLALASNISNSTIARIEGGEQEPTPETLKKLAPFLGASYEELMSAAGYIDLAQVKEDSERYYNYSGQTYDLDKILDKGKVVITGSKPLTKEQRQVLKGFIKYGIQQEGEQEKRTKK